MQIAPYLVIYVALISLQLVYYVVRQQLIAGIYAIGAFSVVLCTFLLGSCVVFFFPLFRQPEVLMPFVLGIHLLALAVAYIKPLQKRIITFLQKVWFYSLLAISSALILSMLFQAVILSQAFDAPYQISELVSQTGAISYITLILVYFSILLYNDHINRRQHEMIGFQLSPILAALDLELRAYQTELLKLKPTIAGDAKKAIVQAMEERLQTSKMPLFANSTDVSMALYPYLSATNTENTWLQVELMPIPTADLANLLTMLCAYLKAYDPELLLGVQLTPLTEGRLYLEIQGGIMSASHLQQFIKRQKLQTPTGTIANAHIVRASLRYCLKQHGIFMKHIVLEESRQAIVLYR